MKARNYRWLVSLVVSSTFLVAARDLWAVLSLSTSSNLVSLPIFATDYNPSTGAAQIIRSGVQTLSIKSNQSTWTLSMRALRSVFTFIPSSGDPDPNKPAADLAVRIPSSSTTWFPMSTSSQVIDAGPDLGPSQNRALDYRLDSTLTTDPPGSYTLTVIYTLTSP